MATTKELHVRITRDLLLLVSLDVPVEDIAGWTPTQRRAAEKWAVKSHLRASDNYVRVPQKPAFIDGYDYVSTFNREKGTVL